MRQLVNLSNTSFDEQIVAEMPGGLDGFLDKYELDGVEMFFYGAWNGQLAKNKIVGAHLRFWPCWLDFWREDKKALREEFHTPEQVKLKFGGLTPNAWLQIWRENIRQAVEAGARYLVLHVSDVCLPDMYTWQFRHSDREVIQGTIELVNALQDVLPDDVTLLFENLWWPGLRLNDPLLLEDLLGGVKHQKCGIMLDTGHLMNTNQTIKNEEDGLRFVIKTVNRLGCLVGAIQGVHLSCSVSGDYVRALSGNPLSAPSPIDVMKHVSHIDQHRPCTSALVEQLVELIQPQWLVHEFAYSSAAEWSGKVACQRNLLTNRRLAI